jgi:hypothetical protein
MWQCIAGNYVCVRVTSFTLCFMFEAAVLMCCSEARDILNVITWNNGANLPDCTLFVYPLLYLPLHRHSPLQPLTTSTMLCHWFLYCVLSFKLLIPRICTCRSLTSNLLTEGLCLFLVCSGFVKVSFQWGFKPSDLESSHPTFVMSGSLYSTHSPLLYLTHHINLYRPLRCAGKLPNMWHAALCVFTWYKFQCPC